MNEQNEIDRRTAAWLEDGPSRAPERSIDSALAHARAHPRRRDPLAFIRKDPMNAHTSPISAAVRPLALVAVLALVLAAAFAVATVGGFFESRTVVVPPVATPSAAPSASANPSASPSPAVITVDLIEHVGDDATIDITDLSGTLVSAVSADPGDGASVPDGAVETGDQVADPRTIVLTWSGSPCDTTHQMTIAPDGVTITIDRPVCQGDSIGVDHVLRLTFDHTVDVTKVVPSLRTIQP